MKRILSTALAIVLLVGTSQAQTTDSIKHRKNGRGDAFAELNRTADQKAQLKDLREAEKKEMDVLKADGKSEADREARKAVRDKYRSQMESVLTPEQKAKIAEGRGKRGDRMGKPDRKDSLGRRGFGDGGRREMAEELNLTADQKTKVAALNQSFKTKMGAIRNNTSLSAEEKKAQSRIAAEEHRKSLQTVLTAEQIAKLKTHRGKGQRRDRSETL